MKIVGGLTRFRYVRYTETISEIEGFHFRCEGRQGQDLQVYALIGRSNSWLREINLGVYLTAWKGDEFSLEVDEQTIDEMEQWRAQIFEEFVKDEVKSTSTIHKILMLRGADREDFAFKYAEVNTRRESNSSYIREYPSRVAIAIKEWFVNPFLPDNY